MEVIHNDFNIFRSLSLCLLLLSSSSSLIFSISCLFDTSNQVEWHVLCIPISVFFFFFLYVNDYSGLIKIEGRSRNCQRHTMNIGNYAEEDDIVPQYACVCVCVYFEWENCVRNGVIECVQNIMKRKGKRMGKVVTKTYAQIIAPAQSNLSPSK